MIHFLNTPKLSDVRLMRATVLSVDQENLTCDVQPIDETSEYLDVSLRSISGGGDGSYVIPAVGSVVTIAALSRNDAVIVASEAFEAVVVKAGETTVKVSGSSVQIEAQAVEFNGGELGGLVKINELTTELNKVKAILTGLLNVINLAPIPEPGSGSPSAFQTAFKAALTGSQIPDFSNLENPAIKQ